MGNNTAKWNEMGTAKEHILENRDGQLQLQREQERLTAMDLWIRGYTVPQIAEQLGRGRGYVVRLIQDSRKEIVKWHKDDFINLAAERIEGFRLIQREGRGFIELYPNQTSQLLNIIFRSEENIAKIEGVLTDKVHHIGKITHEIKMYDFEDNFPTAVRKLEAIEERTSGREEEDLQPDFEEVYEGGEQTIIRLGADGSILEVVEKSGIREQQVVTEGQVEGLSEGDSSIEEVPSE